MAVRQFGNLRLEATAQGANSPWSAEQLALACNGCSTEPPRPAESERRLLFSGDGTVAPSLERIDGGWALRVPEGVRMGLPASAEKPANANAKIPAARIETAAYRPAGAANIYHPAMIGRFPENIVRRRNGKRMQQHGFIFNSDDREVFNPGDDYPWRCAGRLLIWNKPGANFPELPDATGTATLVGPNMVVTSSHMIPKNLSSWTGIFMPGLFDTKMSFNLASWVKTWRQYLPYDQGSDLAILRLYTPIGEQLGWFGSKTYNSSWQDGNYWTRIGYAPIPAKGSDGRRPNRVQYFPIIDDDDSYGVELEYRSDATPGDSGGPVFGWWNGSPYLVGVHSGGETEFDFAGWANLFTVNNNVAAGGPALPDLINWGWANWQ